MRSSRSVASVATDLGLPQVTVFQWRANDQIDHGEQPGMHRPSGVISPRPYTGSRSWRPSWSW